MLRRWTAWHEQWKQDVGCVACDSDDGLLFFDPLAPPADLGEPDHTFVTTFFHAREARGRVWAPSRLVRRLSNRGVEVTDPFEPGDLLPGGVRCFETAREGEVLYWLPQGRALVVGDVLLGKPELRLCPPSWLRPATQDDLKASLQPLLDLPTEQILVSHGEPVLQDGRRALAALLA
jgi:glyoxylase-like metal-dependent hydrolase (beta-lactamase superfamily II)